MSYTHYPGEVNSPQTTLSGDITNVATTIPVTELGVFPTAPNLAVIGTGEDAETILYTGKSAASGAGNLTGVTREFDKSGSYGAKKAWSSGETIGRNFTQYDLYALQQDMAALHNLAPLVYKGVINCGSNPNYPAADAGHTYQVSVAGKIGGASGPNVEVGDLLLCKTDSSASGDHATVGANWDIVQANIDGAVTGPASVTADGDIALFSGTGGKVIKDSSKTIVTTLGSDDTTVPTSKAVKDVTDAKIAKTTDITSLNETGIADGEICVFNKTNKDIRTSDVTIATTIGADDTTVPTSKAVKDYKVDRGMMLMPGAAMVPITLPATLDQGETTTYHIAYIYGEFAATGTQYLQWMVEMEEGWDGGNLTAIFEWLSNSAGSGDVKWSLDAYRFTDNIALDTNLANVITATDTFLGAGKVHKTAESATFTITGTGNFIIFRLSRDNTVGSNLADYARILAIKLKYLSSTSY